MMDRFLRRFENVIAPFADQDDAAETRRIGQLRPLPSETNRFIWHFAKQAKWPFIGLLITGIWLIGFAATVGLGTYGRIQFREQYRRRMKNEAARNVRTI